VNREWQYPGTESKAAWFDSKDVLWAQTENRVVYLPLASRRVVDPGMALRSWSAAAVRSVHTGYGVTRLTRIVAHRRSPSLLAAPGSSM